MRAYNASGYYSGGVAWKRASYGIQGDFFRGSSRKESCMYVTYKNDPGNMVTCYIRWFFGQHSESEQSFQLRFGR